MPEIELIPAAQAELTVANVHLVAVLLPDGQTGAVLSMLCEALDLRTRSQAQKLRVHPVLAQALVLTKMETAGGEQVVKLHDTAIAGAVPAAGLVRPGVFRIR
jgi:hypothetical protein